MGEVIKILHVLGRLGIGGAESLVMNWFRNIDVSLVHFDFIEHTENEDFFESEIYSLGSCVYHCPQFNGKNYIKYRQWWVDFFRQHSEYKIIHSHVRSSASIYIPIAKKYGVKTIIHSHSTSNGRGIESIVKKILQYKLRFQADYFMACSHEAGEWLFGRKVCNSGRYYLIPNAIDIDRFKNNVKQRENYRKQLGIYEKKVFIHVGSFREAKNHIFLLNVFYEIHARNADTVLILVGDGELREKIKLKIEELSIEDSVLMLGNRNDVPELLNASDVFLFPSVWEGLPVSVIEAQAAQLPCLISDQISKDVVISKLVTQLPIDNYDLWIDWALKDLPKMNVTDNIRAAGYDVRTSAGRLCRIYESL